MKNDYIKTETVVAYNQCRRKAHFLLRGEPQPIPHEFEAVLAKRTALSHSRMVNLGDQCSCQNLPIPNDPRRIAAGDLDASCDVLVQRNRRSPNEHVPYEPYLVVGTHSITYEQKLSLAFAGYVVGESRRYRPSAGYIVTYERKLQKVRLEPLYPRIQSLRLYRISASFRSGLLVSSHRYRQTRLCRPEASVESQVAPSAEPMTFRPFEFVGK